MSVLPATNQHIAWLHTRVFNPFSCLMCSFYGDHQHIIASVQPHESPWIPLPHR